MSFCVGDELTDSGDTSAPSFRLRGMGPDNSHADGSLKIPLVISCRHQVV